jgi:O-antigen ligase
VTDWVREARDMRIPGPARRLVNVAAGDAHDLSPVPATTAGGLLLLLCADALVIGAPPGLALLILAALATAALAMDGQLGPLPAALAVVVALPFGRGADVINLTIGDLPIRPQDVAILIGVLGTLTMLRRPRREDRLPMLLVGAFLATGLLAVPVGLAFHSQARDLLRDVKWWTLYGALGLALIARVPPRAILRGALLGATLFALTTIAASALPVLEGGLKDQELAYDHGTLRMQFDNTIFLFPAIAHAAWRTLSDRSYLWPASLALFSTALVLSLTRMSLLAAAGLMALICAAAIAGPDRRPLATALRRTFVVAGVAAIGLLFGIGLDIIGTPTAAATAGGENPVQRIIFVSGDSDLSTSTSAEAGRFTAYRNAIDLIADSPIVGRGMGSLVPVPYAYNEARASTLGKQPGVDDAFLTIALKAGIIGCLAFAGLLAWVLLAPVRVSGFRSWFLPLWLAIIALMVTQSFAVASFGPLGLAMLAALAAQGSSLELATAPLPGTLSNPGA